MPSPYCRILEGSWLALYKDYKNNIYRRCLDSETKVYLDKSFRSGQITRFAKLKNSKLLEKSPFKRIKHILIKN
jgi:hypothetical protein